MLEAPKAEGEGCRLWRPERGSGLEAQARVRKRAQWEEAPIKDAGFENSQAEHREAWSRE